MTTMNAYQQRDAILANMGYESYKAYLASDVWKRIRLRVLKKDGFKCRSCGGPATQVHHSRYDHRVMRGTSLRGLWSACDDCHEGGEFTPDGKKRTISACNDAMGVLMSKPQLKWRAKRGLPSTWAIPSHR